MKFWVTNKTTKERWQGEEAGTQGIGDFCCRAVLVPETPSTALLWIAVVPYSLEDLKEKLPSDYKNNNCPQVTFALGHGGARAVRVNLAVEEQPRENCGFGCFPMMEWLTSEAVAFPDPMDLRRSLHTFMRATKGMNNPGVKTLLEAMEDPVKLAEVSKLPHIWPEAPFVDVVDDDGRKC